MTKRQSRYTQASNKASQRYQKENMLCIAFRLNRNTEPELIEKFQAIPNKRQWFIERLREWNENSQ